MPSFSLLKPPPYQPEITDTSSVNSLYRYWRLRTFYAMYLGYAFFYFSRKSFICCMPAMQALGMDKVDLGWISSILSLTYGISKFCSGILGDRSNPRYFMSIGLILTGCFNIFFGMSSTWTAFALFWGLNGWFQGWGWPGCARLLTHWYSQSERGRWWSVWNTSHNVGGALIPLLAGYCAEHFGWRCAMYIPGILCVTAGVFLMNRLRDTPQSLGLPPVEKFRGEPGSSSPKEQAALSTREILWEYILCNSFVWMLAIASFFVYVVKTALNDWTMLYLQEMRGYSAVAAGTGIFTFEIGGLFGSIAAGWASDVLFQGKRIPINILFLVGISVVLLAFQIAPPSVVLDMSALFMFGFFIFGPQMLIGVACAELSHKKAAATATGFAGCFAYLGAAAAGAPLGALIKAYGWNSFFLSMSCCGILAMFSMFPLWSVKTNRRTAAAQ